MGFGRDFGAALSMGMMVTTKSKNAQENLNIRLAKHQSLIDRFNDTYRRTIERFEEIEPAWNAAKEALIESGALKVTGEGILQYGWYQPAAAAGNDLHDHASSPAEGIGASMPGVGFFIGAPAIAWTMIGTFGTAATGVAINSLSGAAATTATAAWLGRAGLATTAGLGMRAAPAALGGIGFVVSLPVQAIIGANIAGHKERKAIAEFDKCHTAIAKQETLINRHHRSLNDIGAKIQVNTNRLTTHTAALITKAEFYDKDDPKLGQAVETLVEDLGETQELSSQMRILCQTIKDDFDSPSQLPSP